MSDRPSPHNTGKPAPPKSTSIGKGWFVTRHTDGSMTIKNPGMQQRIGLNAPQVERLRAICKESAAQDAPPAKPRRIELAGELYLAAHKSETDDARVMERAAQAIEKLTEALAAYAEHDAAHIMARYGTGSIPTCAYDRLTPAREAIAFAGARV